MNDIIDEPTPTQKIWQDVSSLQQKHTDALMRLYNAVLCGDHNGAVKANDEITAIEAMQKQAHAAARRHSQKKVYNKPVNQRANAAR
jgi:hypothetical protein